jgi:hypothetical protein
VKFAIAHGIGAVAGEHYNIYLGKILISQAKRFAHNSLDAIASNSKFDLFFGYDEPESGFAM